MTKTEEVREWATVLSNQWLRFEEWLNTLPGRVTSEYSDDSLTIIAKRKGSKWGVFFTDASHLEPTAMTEASLVIKIKAIEMLPQLLMAMEKNQHLLVEDLKQACTKFDRLFETMRLT